ncbi:hypothetical protein CRE_22838 [Caenorhabditis remanei]|uniref:F-box domain-containing protein n=1 Tax=Caenorhabditis remanei TaxID=31234 RepID=E3MHH4_CAERE|nr:hypothetical protein CRE_22838 [Caenorhabditis remanei]
MSLFVGGLLSLLHYILPVLPSVTSIQSSWLLIGYKMDNIPKPFPLLRLPRLVLDEVFIMMRPFELINFSMASLKSKIVMKCFLRTKGNLKYSIEVNTHEEPKVSIVISKAFFDQRMTSEREKHKKEEYIVTRDGFTADRVWIYSENLISDWMKLFKTVSELFNFKRRVVFFRPDTFPDQNKSIIDFIKCQMPIINTCSVNGEKELDDDVEYFLENVDVTESVELHSRLTNKFQAKIDRPLENISINFGDWLNYNQFIQFKSCKIALKKSIISNLELNTFLLSWMSMDSHQHLERLRIPVNDPESYNVILNLPHEVNNVDVIRHGRTARNEVFRMRGGNNIKRNDGVTGTIYFKMDGNQLMFNMIVFVSFV